MDLNVGEIAITLLIGAATAGIASWITWRRAQKSWRHQERYDAVMGVLREARAREALTAEWWRLRERKDQFAARVGELRRKSRSGRELSEARRRLKISEDKLAKVNDQILETAIGVNESSLKLDLLDRGNLADLAADITAAYAKLDKARSGDGDVDTARATVRRTESAFLDAARRELRSGRNSQ